MKLSVITINKNNAVGLEKTIQSAVCQTYPDFEYIVIDGASDDGSVEIIKKFTEKITYWVSEPDRGIYNAMNKGIRKAQGEYCLFLNSGDFLLSPDTLHNAAKELDNKADIFYTDVEQSDGITWHYSKNLTLRDLVFGSINHQNSFIRRSLFIEHGYYNENLKLASDYEFFLREMYIYHTVFFHINTHIALFDINGISTQREINEDRIVFTNVFGCLAELLFELRQTDPVYTQIVTKYGRSELLHKLLKFFLFFKGVLFLIRNKK